jgi:hypothetical protein
MCFEDHSNASSLTRNFILVLEIYFQSLHHRHPLQLLQQQEGHQGQQHPHPQLQQR